MQKKIVIIDYQLGNIFSVLQACKKLGHDAIMGSTEEDVKNADALILPGVGAFGDAIMKMKELGLDEIVKSFHKTGKPIMGICLGMQLFFTKSEEFGTHQGLDLIPGEILKFSTKTENGSRVKVPQTGWNTLKENPNSNLKWKDTALTSISPDDFFYFVHSYYVCPENENDILSYTRYGDKKYCSTINVENIFATQYHPEKSAHKGLEIYNHWLNNI